MKRLLLACILVLLLAPGRCTAGDLSFESFEAAEAAAKKRAQDYQQKMDEHIQNINQKWEQQQKDLGADSSSPDITKITSRADGQQSSDNQASKDMENAVNSSVNKLKDSMISSAGPNSTGFAGGGAGYQWSVKFKDGKYVLSDSYNEAEFNTGDKKEKGSSNPAKPSQPSTPAKTGQNNDNKAVATKPDVAPDGSATNAAPAQPATTNPSSTQVASIPKGSSPSSTGGTPSADTTGAPAKVDGNKPATPGIDPAPPNLPPPAVKLVIQHPTDFSEEIFSSNADAETTTDFQLQKFKIPEDTRIKIAVEVSKDVSPEDVSLVITDDEGERAPVTSVKMKNYRHMFRVPSDDKYSASVFINDKTRPGSYRKKLMQVKIPVTKVDFESRTIDNQRGSKDGNSDSSAGLSSSNTSSSGNSGTFSHSTQSQSQQVDLSDLYSDAGSANSAGSAGAAGNTGRANGSDEYASSGESQGSAVTSSGVPSAGQSQSSSSASSDSGDENYGSSNAAGENSGDSSNAYAGNERANSSAKSGSGNGEAVSDADENGVSSGESLSETGTTAGSSGSESNSSSSNGDSSINADGSSSMANADGSSNEYGDSSGTTGDQSEENGETSGSQNQTSYQVASARNLNVKESKPDGNTDNRANTGKTKDEAITGEDDPFIMAVSIRSEKNKIYQSFDFLDQSTQMSAAIPAGSEVTFSLTMSKKVDPKSVSIRLSDGSQEFAGDIKSMGDSFAYVFPKPSGNSFIQLSGKAEGRPFNYRLSMPVTQK